MSNAKNPAQLLIRMKKVTRKDLSHYYIGNCNLECSLLDTVLFLYPPKSEYGTLEQAAANLLRWADNQDHMEDKQLNPILSTMRQILSNNTKDRTASLSVKTTREVLDSTEDHQDENNFQDE